MHLLSLLSPLDADLVVAYPPLLPVALAQLLAARGIEIVEVPDDEFPTMGTNVLALAPRVALALDGNPVTRSRLEAAGVAVLVYEGSELSVKGDGGPTCLTMPILAGLSSQLRQRERTVRARRHEEVLAMRRLENGVEALPAGARLERQHRPVGEDAVHRQPVAPEVVAEGLKTTKCRPAAGSRTKRSRSGCAVQKNGLSSVLKSARCGIAVPFL